MFLEKEKKDLRDYYDKEYRKLYTPVIGQEVSPAERFEIYLPFQQYRINDIKPYLKPDMKVLDIGCSSGYFLHALGNLVRERVGVEINKADAEFTREKLGIKVYESPLEETDLPRDYFDIVFMFDVLEHLEDPIQFLLTTRKYIKTGGYIYIEVDNVDDSLLSVYGIKEYADFWYREPHLFYFSPKTLRAAAKKGGFIGETKTMQQYNFLNQLNWILTGKPQSSATQGMSTPVLVNSNDVSDKIKKNFNDWIAKIDSEYKKILNKYKLGDVTIFIGRKSK